MSAASREPATVEDLTKPLEAEPGREIQFCPIRQLPIVQSLRVRTLPGFHLLSLDAGKEALARGSYTAYSEKFPCQNLEYLHEDDKVFICAEDNKAFLNEMSMRYHRYIGHELKERKAERKRLRERAEERKVRSATLQAEKLQQQKRSRTSARRPDPQQQALQQPEKQLQPLQQPASPPILPQQEPEPSEIVGGTTAGEAPAPMAATDDPYKATEDPYAAPTEDPYQDSAGAAEQTGADSAGANDGMDAQRAVLRAEELDAARQAAAAAAAVSARRAAQATAPAPVTAPVRSANVAPVGGASPATAQAPSLGVIAQPRTAAAVVPPTLAAAPPREDLYGDIDGKDSKKQKVESTYATAIGAMLDDNFDEDD